MSGILAKTFKVHDKGVVQVAEDGVFINNVVDLLESDDFSLFELFESNILGCRFISGQFNPSKRACAESLEQFIIGELELFGFFKCCHDKILYLIESNKRRMLIIHVEMYLISIFFGF